MRVNVDKIKVFLRSNLFFLFFVGGILFFAAIILLSVPLISNAKRRYIVHIWSRYNCFILALICGLKVRVEGLEKLPPPPYMILSKHQSAWETVTIQAFFPDVILVLKKSLLKIPVFGWALRFTGQIAIDRSQGVSALRLMAKKCKETFDQNRTVMIFPEGTRVSPGEVGKYNPGGVGIALSTGVPIVPIAHNAGEFWAPKAYYKKPGEIQMRIGPAIPTTGLGKGDRKEVNNKVKDTIEGMMEEIAKESASNGSVVE
ncbi:MAG: 1-acyl-sn-glycerol-3-phosphate acyltransferase [Magnetococcales bacterium]|nr:1-acyl-sn-glycerol-3-phosphate acyltransferase [Magnetococcales bacterium]